MAVANAPASPLNLPQPPQAWNTGWQQRYTQALTQASLNWLTKGNDILLDANTTLTLTSADGTTQVTIVANDDGTIGPTPAAPADIRPQNNTWTGTNTFTNTVTLPNGSITAAEVAAGVAVANLGFTPVTQGGVANQGTNHIHIGWDTSGAGLRATVDSTDEGFVLTTGVNSAATADVLTGSSTTKFASVNADWSAVTPVNAGSGTTCALNLTTGINFYFTTTGNTTLSFTTGRNGQSGTVQFLNTSGSNITITLSGCFANAGTNLVVTAGTNACFSYFDASPGTGSVLVARFF